MLDISIIDQQRLSKNLSVAQMNTMTHLIEIATRLMTQFSLSSRAASIDLIVLFPPAKDFVEVINAPFGEQYTSILLAFLKEPKHQQLLSSLLKELPHYVDNPEQLFLKSVHTLHELNMCAINWDQDFLFDCLAIANLLSDKRRVEQAIDCLEEQLQSYVSKDQKFELVMHQNRFFLPVAKEHKPFDRQKIISGFFYHWAKVNYFHPTHYVKVTGILNAADFFSLLKNKLLFKDSGVKYEHGTWTHVLQWFVIFEEEKRMPFLKHHPIALYEHIGTHNYASKDGVYYDINHKYPVGLTKKPETIWDILFDRRSWNKRPEDFRCPETVTQLLYREAQKNHEEKRWPLLSDSIYRTYEKDKATFRISDFGSALNYREYPYHSVKSICKRSGGGSKNQRFLPGKISG